MRNQQSFAGGGHVSVPSSILITHLLLSFGVDVCGFLIGMAVKPFQRRPIGRVGCHYSDDRVEQSGG